ncbi:MAG: XRE family transcriptional regulator [Pseudonocardiaceae bacterium]
MFASRVEGAVDSFDFHGGVEGFSAARERTASPSNPEMCLSRQELADLVNIWVWKHHNKTVFATASYVGKLEIGLIRWPDQARREALRAILSVPRDSDLGFINVRSERAAVKLEKVDRQNLIRGAAALGVGALVQGPLAALLECLGSSEPTPVPKRVGATDIAHTRNTMQVFQSWSLTSGGVVVRDTAMAQLRWSAGLLKAIYPEELHDELHSAVGDLAETAGYIAMDAGADEEARRAFRFALDCAEKAKDWPLRADVLGSMAVHAIRTGQPDEGLTLAEQALVRADRLTATQRSLLHTDRARALATMCRVQEALTAIGAADDHFAQSTSANDPPFLAYHTAAMHAGGTGRALLDLAILGRDPDEATNRLTTAVAEHTVDHARPRALDLTRLASLTMATGDPAQAVAIGHEAVDAVGMIRSRAATDDLRELFRHATAHHNLDEVAHLQHRISTLLVSTDSP